MHNINFSVKPGQKVAIVGSTGAGKTTLINLLMRFYELNGGKITLDGTDTKDMPRSNLRSNFGMVLQDTWLFGGTVAENIAYSKPDATREEIVAAAKAARVDFFVKDDGEVVFNEINTMPGFTAISMYPMLWEARGIGKDQLVGMLLSHGMERYA